MSESVSAILFILVVFIIVPLLSHTVLSPKTYTNDNIPQVLDFTDDEEEFMEDYQAHVSEVKGFPADMCDNPNSEDCTWAIDLCSRTTECLGMVVAYQMSVKGTSNLDKQAFINASLIHINQERVNQGLPPVR